MNKIIILVLIIAICLLIYAFVRSRRNVIEAFTAITGDKQKTSPGYAQVTDGYNKPFVLENFIDPETCKSIIDRSKDKLMDSQVISGKNSTVRNSKQCWIPKSDPLVKELFDRVSTMFNIPVENAEDLQVVRYLPNQYYNEHHDSCCDNHEKCIEFVKKGGQRKLTVLIYLNNEFTDGETNFPKLGFKLKPKTGSGIVFYPLAQSSSKCHPYALHAGLPVSRGEKWVANLWFRENKF